MNYRLKIEFVGGGVPVLSQAKSIQELNNYTQRIEAGLRGKSSPAVWIPVDDSDHGRHVVVANISQFHAVKEEK